MSEEMEIKTIMRYPFLVIRLAKINEPYPTKCWRTYEKIGMLVYGDESTPTVTLENSWQYLVNLKLCVVLM